MNDRSRRRRFDDDLYDISPSITLPGTAEQPGDELDELDDDSDWSTYPDATHGPEPVPDWVLTSASAIDEDLGVLKTGKEADVSLIRRTHDGTSVLMAAKRYRDPKHRMFHRDAGYLEGRRVRKSREMRAMQSRSAFGRELLAGQWANAEFSILGTLWSAGAAVPYPVQLDGTELIIEFIGTSDGVGAPRLAETRPSLREAEVLYEQMVAVLVQVADAGYAHGDLSPYNVLVHEGRLVLIDMPQAVDLVGNPQGFGFLHRDCVNICTWFAARGVDADALDLERTLLQSVPRA